MTPLPRTKPAPAAPPCSAPRAPWIARAARRFRRPLRFAATCALLAASSCRSGGPFLHSYRSAPVAGCPPMGASFDGGAGVPGSGPLMAGAPASPSLFGLPLPQMLVLPWAPPGIALPWPKDEYLADGGDRDVQVTVNNQGGVNGLELEDTIVHYDTLDGRTLVEPSNRVHLYAPRFAAVRSVEQTWLNEQRDQISQTAKPVGPQIELERVIVTTAVQPEQPVGEIGVNQPSLAHLKQGRGVLLTREIPYGAQDRLGSYEDFDVIRLGLMNEEQQPRLAESVDAAIAWSGDQALQVVVGGTPALVETGDQRAQATFRFDLPENPRLRVIKVASTAQARPGDLVEFTIRYDNVGDAPIGNVTLIDNLTTRLEYVEDSAKSSRDAQFFADPNQGDSLALRWEFAAPLDPGQGGLVRFKCRVR